jgi:hypothetical protein
MDGMTTQTIQTAAYALDPPSWLGLHPVPTSAAPVGSSAHTVYIAGSGHSGSTLLDMLLGGHPQMASLGEVIFLTFNATNDTPADRCTCGRHVLECPFWQRVETGAQQLLGVDEPVLRRLAVADPKMVLLRKDDGVFNVLRPGERYPFRSRADEAIMLAGSARLRRAAAERLREVGLRRRVSINLNFLYDAARVGLGVPIVIDSTKNAGYLKGVWLERTSPMTFIVLRRDGRALCHSRMEREGVTMRAAAKMWLVEQVKQLTAMATIPRSAQLVVRYEDLATDTEGQLRRICTRLGVAYDPVMLTFRQDRHNLGGNPMRFRRDEHTISIDERWRQGLSDQDLRDFAAVAGPLNRFLGYGAR